MKIILNRETLLKQKINSKEMLNLINNNNMRLILMHMQKILILKKYKNYNQ